MLPKLSRLVRLIYKPRPNLHRTNENQNLSWMEDLTNLRVQKYIKAENRYASLQLLSTKLFQQKVRRFLKEVSRQNLQSTNETGFKECSGQYTYYERKSADSLPSIYRRHTLSGEETMILNQQELALETGFLQLFGIKPSPCGMFLAAILRTDHTTESCSCFIYKLERSKPRLCATLNNVGSAEWCNDGSSLIVSIASAVGSVNQIKQFRVSDSSQRQLLIEKDPRFSFDLLKTRDSKFIIAHSNSKHCSEVYVLDANCSKQGFRCMVTKEDGSECFVDHWGDMFYAIRKSGDDEDYGVSKLKDETNGGGWQEIYTTKKNCRKCLHDMEIYHDGLVLYELDNLIPQLRFMPFDEDKCDQIHKASDHPSVMESFSNQSPQANTIRYTITSPIQPVTLFEYDRANESSWVVQSSLPTWKSSAFQCRLLESRSKDGTNIPMTVFFSNNVKDLSEAPAFLNVYGSYGEPVNMRFSPETAFLLMNGWILAFPHVRGGGEFGRKWYKDATKLHKCRTFQDLEASVSCLHASGFSAPRKTAVFGMSAGALPVAVLCNEAPDTLRAAVLKVPFLDVLNSMSNERMGLTVQEYEEWGNPLKSNEDYINIKSYCPVQNLKFSMDFPSVYLTSYLDDERVPAWMPLKWAAKWRKWPSENSGSDCNNLVLCRIYDQGGHFGSPHLSHEAQMSEMIAFLYKSLELPVNFKSTSQQEH